MKVLALILLASLAVSAFANGTWHGAYLGKGKVTNSCTNEAKEYVSMIDWSGFDPGTYFYYGLRFADSLRIVANDVVLSRSRKAVFGDSDLSSGNYESYEDCPGRDVCEGFCCDYEGSDAQQETPNMSLGAIKNDSEGGSRKYPIKTEVELKFKNGEQVSLSWIEPDKHKADINLEGKITLADGCRLTWQDKIVWHDKKPEEIKETLHCIGGRCRWKNTSASKNE